MAIWNFFKSKAPSNNSLPTNEERSYTYGDIKVSDWDSSFGYGNTVDKLSVVYGCVNLRASTIASLPFGLLAETDKGDKPAVDHPYFNLLTKTPNPYQTPYTFWHWAITQLDLHGNAYIQKIRRNDGLVSELIPLNPHFVEVSIDDMTGKKRYKMDINGRQYVYEDDNILHLMGYSHNGVYGISVVEHFRQLFDGYLELEKSGTQIAKNAAKPSVVIYHPANLKDDEKEKTRLAWQNGFRGNNSGKAAMLPNTYKLEPMSVGLSAADSEYIKQKQFTAQRIATDLFRCPLHMLGLTTSPTYASVEQQAIEWVQYGLTPTITNIEQQVQRSLLGNDDSVYFDISVNGLLRGDTAARLSYYKFAMEHGAMTPNQFHVAEGTGLYVPPEQGGDSYTRPLNFSSISGSKASE